MPHISSFDRNQSFFFCIDDFIEPDNSVRIIDAFVDSLNLEELGFVTFDSSSPGQQPYSRFALLKLLLYGYTKGIRSSRKLADACSDSISFMWLVNGISPSKSCICDFVKVNETAIQNTFKLFVRFLLFADFIDAKIDVIDGTKIRAQNSRNKYFSIKKIDNTISYFNSQIKHFTSLLKDAQSDAASDPDAAISFNEKISNYKQKIEEFSNLKKKLNDNNLSQITLTDPDSRMMTSHGNSDISYNMQTSVDSKNSLIVTSDVVSDINDTNQLENMLSKSADVLGRVPDNTVADMGYFNTEQIDNCENLGSNVFVKQPKSKNSTNNSDFSIDKFSYDAKRNIYTCPAGKQLKFVRKLSKKKNKSDDKPSIIGYEYFCSDCAGCPYLHDCTSSVNGRRVTRNAYQDTIDRVQKRFKENPEMYTIRKSVVEHPFGTIKRSLGFTYFLRRGLNAVRTEASLICLAYDIKRLANISNIDDIKKKLEEFFLHFRYFFQYLFLFFKKIINSKNEFMIFLIYLF